jgi:apolipoprotein N-acyltransferase
MKLLLAFFAGILLPFAFAPYEYYWLAPLSLFLLLFSWENATPKAAFYRGFLFGLSFFGGSVYWVYISIHTFGGSNIFVAGIITLLFVFILSLFIASNGYILNRYFSSKHRHCEAEGRSNPGNVSLDCHVGLRPPRNDEAYKYWIAFPAAWSLLEWIRSWIFTGFPWVLLGYSQTGSPLHGFAPIVGIYGVSFLTALSGSLLFTYLRHKSNSKRWLSFLLLLIIWMSGFFLSKIHWTTPISKPLHVSLIQGNIPQSIKWSADEAFNSLSLYQHLSKQHWQNANLIIWPETAVTLFLQDATPFLEELDQSAKQKNIAIITGIPSMKIDNNNQENYFNSAIVLGEGNGFYTKRHLVPFGEYTPFKKILGKLLDILHLPMSDFSEGNKIQPLMKIQGYYIAPFICYEIAYSDLLRTDLPKANILITLSNDTWFDQSSALGQHRQIAQFAAESTGRYMLVVTNSGETVIINPEGEIIGKAQMNQTAVLEGTVNAVSGTTPWIKLGNLPFIFLFILLLIIPRFRR